ncbi:MAG TPA: hypothetical protein VN939_14800 [Chthoniobacterales bacterium]|jgi:hypothetical protein|nr:hypothetical protein [Chthoniobacterales bacterium]
MKVAWHEVPGRVVSLVRPVGHGMIRSGRMPLLSKDGVHTSVQKPSRPARHALSPAPNWIQTEARNHTVPYGTDFSRDHFQALRARLPSSSPFGTRVQPDPEGLGKPIHKNIVNELNQL